MTARVTKLTGATFFPLVTSMYVNMSHGENTEVFTTVLLPSRLQLY